MTTCLATGARDGVLVNARPSAARHEALGFPVEVSGTSRVYVMPLMVVVKCSVAV